MAGPDDGDSLGVGCQGLETFRMMRPGGSGRCDAGGDKEIVYQATAYLGMGRTLDF
ncbi:MAG: hypothetical protein ACLTC4_15550 [Hungatella hathewayi]